MTRISNLVLMSALIFSFNARAELPGEFCHGERFCSIEQLDIWEAFLNASEIQREKVPQVYSGGCYHTGNYDPSTEHHGLVLIDENSDQLYFGGRFMFFSSNNPYSDLDVDSAREKLGDVIKKKNFITEFDDHASVDYSDENTMWKYWLRHDNELDSLLVVAVWGANQKVFCELYPN